MAIENFPVIKKIDNPYEFAPVIPANIKKVDMSRPNVPLVQTAPIVYSKPKAQVTPPKEVVSAPVVQTKTNKSWVIQAMIQKNPRLAEAYNNWQVNDNDIFNAAIKKYPKIKSAVLAWEVELNTVDNKWTESWWSFTQWLKDTVWWVVEWANSLNKLWEKAGNYLWEKIVSNFGSEEMKAKQKAMQDSWQQIWWPTIWETLKTWYDKAWVNTESGAFKTGKLWAETVISTALSTVWWAALWIWGKISKLWTVAKATWSFAEWALNTQVGSLLWDQKAASLKDTLIWGTVWAGLSLASSAYKFIKWWQLAKKALEEWKVTESMLNSKGRKILDILKERDTTPLGRAAIESGKLNTKQWWLSQLWNGSSKYVQPSQKTLNSTQSVISNIKNVSTDPQTLFTQVGKKVTEMWEELSPQLRKISNIWHKGKKELITWFENMLEEAASDFWPSDTKKIAKLVYRFKWAKNLDEVWSVAKDLDASIPQKIKEWINLSSKEQWVYNTRRSLREPLNKYMDDAAWVLWEWEIANKFKIFKELYHAKSQIKNNIGDIIKPVVWLKKKLVDNARNVVSTTAKIALASKLYSKFSWWGKWWGWE